MDYNRTIGISGQKVGIIQWVKEYWKKGDNLILIKYQAIIFFQILNLQLIRFRIMCNKKEYLLRLKQIEVW